MVHVASEMERLGMTMPLLIGGATTSLKHTAIKIAPVYGGVTVHVADASRAVGVVSELLSERKSAYIREVQQSQEALRDSYPEHAPKLISYEAARARRFEFVTGDAEASNGSKATSSTSGIARPDRLGVESRTLPLAKLVEYIDWTPFFHAWELRGSYPAILERAEVGPIARELFDNARRMLDQIVEEQWLEARAVHGFFPANSRGDDIELYEDESRSRLRATFHTLRQQREKAGNQTYYALADFLAPKESGILDYLGAFAVTAGIGIEDRVAGFERAGDDYQAILLKALADRLAEAAAEYLHEQARIQCGFGAEENLTKGDLIRERYRGIRPAPGYPACPDHTEKGILFRLLDVEARIGIRLTESFAMWPAASVSGFYINHPEARYFAVGKIGRDQVEEYARRRGVSVEEAEIWLAPNLGYAPGTAAPVS